MFTPRPPPPPPPPPKKETNCKTIVFDFSNDNCSTVLPRRNFKQWLCKIFFLRGGGKQRCMWKWWILNDVKLQPLFFPTGLSRLESRLIWEKLSKFLRLIITVGKHAGRQKWTLRNYFCSFYPFELKVCKMVHTFPPVKSALLLLF